MNTLVCLTSTNGTWIRRKEVDANPAKRVRGVNSDVGYHDRSGSGRRGRGLDVLYPGVHSVLPVLGHHYEINSTAGDVIGADDEWTIACRMGSTCEYNALYIQKCKLQLLIHVAERIINLYCRFLYNHKLRSHKQTFMTPKATSHIITSDTHK